MRDRATVQCWSDMKQRCMNEAHPQYKNYGGRGIHICQRWLESVDNFIADMGVKPEGLTSGDTVARRAGASWSA